MRWNCDGKIAAVEGGEDIECNSKTGIQIEKVGSVAPVVTRLSSLIYEMFVLEIIASLSLMIAVLP